MATPVTQAQAFSCRDVGLEGTSTTKSKTIFFLLNSIPSSSCTVQGSKSPTDVLGDKEVAVAFFLENFWSIEESFRLVDQ